MGGLADRIAVVRQQLEELRQPRNRPTRARLEAALDEFASSLDDLEDLSDQLDAETEGLTRAAERIDDERRRFEDLFELAPDGYVVTDSGGRVMEANRELLGMLGLSYEAVDGLPIAVFFDGEGRRRLYEVLDRSTRGEVLPAWQTVIEPRGGRPFPASVRCAARHDSDGRAVGVRLIIRDISAIVDAHRREEDAFDAARQRLAELTVLQEATREIAGLLDGPAIVRAIARHASRIRPESSVHAGVLEVTEHAARVVAHHDPSGLADHSGAVIQLTPDPRLLDSVGSPHPWTWQAGELSKMARRVVAPLGLLHGAMVGIPGGVEGIHLAVATSDPRPFSDEELGMLESLAGISSIALNNAASYQNLSVLATTDPLTALPNRRYVERLLGMPQERGLSVLAIDVDNLKDINDTQGHEAGDAALRAVSQTLKACLREGDIVARTGGDEFVAILYGAGETDATAVAQRMRETMHSVILENSEARISVGIAVAAAEGDLAATWHAADRALYAAKASGKDRVIAYAGGELLPARPSQGRWADTLAAILGGQGLVSVYQPIVRLDDRSVVGYEALARPAGAVTGMSIAGLFDAARKLGVHRDLDWMARRSALCGSSALPSATPLFVNVCIAALLDPLQGADQMQLLVASSGRSPRNVIIELSEREPLRDAERFESVLEEYRAQGFRVAIDGVGESHLGLDVLTRARPAYLKLSATFVRRASEPALRAVVAFARAIGAVAIVQGIENDEDLNAATALGIGLGQGFHLGRPSKSFGAVPVGRVSGHAVTARRRTRTRNRTRARS